MKRFGLIFTLFGLISCATISKTSYSDYDIYEMSKSYIINGDEESKLYLQFQKKIYIDNRSSKYQLFVMLFSNKEVLGDELNRSLEFVIDDNNMLVDSVLFALPSSQLVTKNRLTGEIKKRHDDFSETIMYQVDDELVDHIIQSNDSKLVRVGVRKENFLLNSDYKVVLEELTMAPNIN
ncbi:MAG: hypothetical protein K9N07_10605 [Candidatus Cloacimonetes bacterium]|nr:hypothetical protein [Candidatus Cloacimonadota bacterium]MCF8262298.1 hypothetical protein [Melioribacteraceae bacterium]